MTAKKTQNSGTYDEMYNSQGETGAYALPYKSSCYFPLYKHVKKTLLQKKISKILEVGCGAGSFAHYILESSKLTYKGFDFSPVAVLNAKKRTGLNDIFYVGDAKDPKSYIENYDAIVCTEVLEHVDEDLEIVKRWKTGSFCVCSVPNYDSSYHVRHFKTKKEILNRYSNLIDIDNITQLKKPIIENISLENRLKELRWSRYKLHRIIELFGLGDFDKVGGWFVFSGKKNNAQ